MCVRCLGGGGRDGLGSGLVDPGTIDVMVKGWGKGGRVGEGMG